MQTVPNRHSPDSWIDQLFSSKSARRGAVVRRSIAWVDREIGQARFQHEVQRRGDRLLRTADQFIIICHRGPIEIVF